MSDADRPRLVRVAVSYRSVEVVADPSVTGAFVSGEHTVRRDGETLVVEASALPFLADDDEPGARFSFSNLPKTIARARNWQNEHLTVRFNPELPIEIDVAGASVRLVGGEAGARIRLLASALKVDRVRGPLDVDAVSSSVKGTLGPTGSSRISAESSSVKVQLLAGTGVRIHARNRMGKVVLPNSITKGDMVDPGLRESVIGSGEGELAVESVMSSVVIGAASSVRAPTEPRELARGDRSGRGWRRRDGDAARSRRSPAPRPAAGVPAAARLPGVQLAARDHATGLPDLRHRSRRPVRAVRLLRAR